jgi:hypothetical protein
MVQLKLVMQLVCAGLGCLVYSALLDCKHSHQRGGGCTVMACVSCTWRVHSVRCSTTGLIASACCSAGRSAVYGSTRFCRRTVLAPV